MKLITCTSRVLSGAVVRPVFDNRVTGLHYENIVQLSVRTMASKPGKKALTIENVNPNIVALEYAVRGPLVVRALEIEKEIKKVCGFYL